MATALIILARKGYQDLEFAGTKKGLAEAGFAIVIAAQETGTCFGKFGGTQEASVALQDIDISQYNRIAFIGGPGAGALAEDPVALKIANEAYRANMPLGAICIAPIILAKARVLNGKRATVWDAGGEQIALLEQYGATYTGERVTVDGNIVTGNGPEAAEEFGRTFAAL